MAKLITYKMKGDDGLPAGFKKSNHQKRGSEILSNKSPMHAAEIGVRYGGGRWGGKSESSPPELEGPLGKR